MVMTADEAYAEAERRIESAKIEGAIDLNLSDLVTLTNLPPLQGFSELRIIDLNNTQVADIAPLHSIPELRHLNLSNTQISDIAPLQSLSALQNLFLGQTQVADITPLQRLTALRNLILYRTLVTDITALQGLTALEYLYLNDTQVADIEPLRGLSELRQLYLMNTQVVDIAPLQSASKLNKLNIHGTQVEDLRLIADHPFEFEASEGLQGLGFSNTPAAASSAELTELSKIEDNRERTDKTLAYLRDLPPYPEPLPWEAVSAPKTDNLPRIAIAGRQIDVAHELLDASDLTDPIKARLYERLKASVADLVRLGNCYPELNSPANALNDILATPFEESDLFDIHLEVAVLTDLIAINPTHSKAEQLDAECLQVVQKVTRLGPPLTLGNPDVELFEKRNLQYAQQKRDEAVANSERAMAQALVDSPMLTERASHFAGIAANAPMEGRTASYRASYVKNMILVGVSALAGGVANDLAKAEVIQALEFIHANKDGILAVATSWGAQGQIWAADLIARSGEALRKYRA